MTYLVTKYYNGGDLLEYCQSKDHILGEKETRYIFTQLAQGVQEMHSKGIVHRDLKHLNVFLSNTSSYPRVKIGDFDLAYRLPDGEHSSINLDGGTVPFFSPERA